MASNVLEEFFISIGVDSKDLKAGEKAVTSAVLGMQKSLEKLTSSFNQTTKNAGDSQRRLGQSTDKLNKDLQSSVGRINSFFNSIKNNILALAGVSLTMGGAMAWIGNTTKGLVELGVQSKALGISAKEVDGWGRAFKVAGSSADAAVQSLKAIQDAKNSLQLGRPTAFFQTAEMLNNMTGAPKRIDWANADAGAIQKQIAGMLQKVSKEQALYFGGQLGYDQAAIMGMRSGEIQANQRKFTASSGVTDEQIQKAKEQAEALEEMKQKMDALKLSIYEKVVPALTEWINWINSHWDAISQFFMNTLTYIRDVAVAANKLAQDLGGWKVVIGAIIGLKFAAWLIAVASAARGAMGMAALGRAGGVAAAGVGGYAAGTMIYDNLIAGTKTGDVIGAGVAKTLALFGNKNAQEAVSLNDGNQKAVSAVKAGVKDAPVVSKKNDRDASEERAVWTDVKGLLKAIVGNTDALKNQSFGFGEAKSSGSLGSLNVSDKIKENAAKFGFGNLETKYGLPKGMLSAIHAIETGNTGKTNQVNAQTGATGGFQFLAGTAKQYGVQDRTNLAQSAEGAAKYLSHLLKLFHGDLEKAVRAYHAGEGNVQRGTGMGKYNNDYWNKFNRYTQAISTPQYKIPRALARPSNTTTHIQHVTVQSPASSVNQLTNDINRQTRLNTANAFITGSD